MKRQALIGTLCAVSALAVCGLVLAEDPPSEKEERAAHAEFGAQSDAILRSFVTGFDPAIARTLPSIGLDMDPPRIPSSLTDALSQSDVVVVGSVRETRFEFQGNSITHNVVTLDVRETLKGRVEPNSELLIRQIGGPEPGANEGGHRHPYLAESAADPLLFSGDVAILLLERISPDTFAVLASVGQLHVENAIIKPLESNPFGPELAGLQLAAATARILAATP